MSQIDPVSRFQPSLVQVSRESPSLNDAKSPGSRRSDGMPSGRRVWNYLYSRNPFYLLSCLCLLAGLFRYFHDPRMDADIYNVNFNSWTMLASLACYTTLLAIVGCTIIRLGQVWDDVRTILLSIVLLLVALSIGFDKPILLEALNREVRAGKEATLPAATLSLIGLAFASMLSELTIVGMRIRLPRLYRIPYHLTLALLFLYPLVILQMYETVGERSANRGRDYALLVVMLFPAAAALVAATLLPAVRNGAGAVANNGTPWNWPWYPWPLFVFLGAAIVFRANHLAIAFHPRAGTTSGFAPAFLSPLVFVVSLLMFEAARGAKDKLWQAFALSTPVCWTVIVTQGWSETLHGWDYLQLHLVWFGSPVRIAAGFAAAAFAYGSLRGGPSWSRGAALLSALVAMSTNHLTYNLSTLAPPSKTGWIVAAFAGLWFALEHPRDARRWSMFALLASVAAAMHGRDAKWSAILMMHLLAVSCWILGAVFSDDLMQRARRFATLGLAAAGFIVAWIGAGWIPSRRLPFDVSPVQAALYLAGIAAIVLVLGIVSRRKAMILDAALLSGNLVVLGGIELAEIIAKTRDPEAVLLTLAGGAMFLLATGISLMKVLAHRAEPISASTVELP